MALTVPVGEVSASSIKLMKITEEALQVGINAAQGGNKIGDISHAIEKLCSSA